MLTVGSLFSGIGGLDLGLERAGMKVVWQSEIDPYACRVLRKHWPEVANHGDIKRIEWDTVERPDVICGGYPCQPFSTAGKRRGTDDPRHLWPWVRDAISALRPRYAILENVRGHLSMGGTVVLGDLAEIGYNAEWRVIPASGVGAPHRRDRIFIVAYPDGRRLEKRESEIESLSDSRLSCERATNVAYTDNRGHVYAEVPEESDIRRRGAEDGRLQWEIEPDVGRVAHGIPARVDRLRGLGNAVVPQVAEYVGRLVMEHYRHSLKESEA